MAIIVKIEKYIEYMLIILLTTSKKSLKLTLNSKTRIFKDIYVTSLSYFILFFYTLYVATFRF